ncbi:histidine kinase, partial [bacterium]|nr:histidine kinase [bacterium]
MVHYVENPFSRETLTEDILKEWQHLLDVSAEILGVPAGLITRIDGDEIEILLSSKTEGNPYPAACVAQYPDSGWYCEHTLKSRELNLIPNALHDVNWKTNAAAVDMHMISYAGMPIECPGGELFGT